MTMKTWMKASIAASLIAAAGLASTAVMARGGDCGAYRAQGGKAAWHQMAPEQVQERMQQRAEVGLARLELALALKPEQQSAWNDFKTSMSAQAERMGERMGERMQQRDGQPQTAIERMQRMEEMSTLRQATLAETRTAVEAFYATLSDAQKTVFDSEFGRMERGGRHGMGHGRGMGPGRS
jgi:hypothetical protein